MRFGKMCIRDSIYTGEGQDIGQFWAELNVGNAKVKKTTANAVSYTHLDVYKRQVIQIPRNSFRKDLGWFALRVG